MPRVFLRSIPDAMCDAGCGNTIIGALAAKGIPVDHINVNIPARSCTIVLPDSISLQDSEIEAVLEAVGFSSFGTKSDIFKLFCRGLGGVFFGLVLLLLTAWGIAIPFIVALISIGASVYLGWETYTQAWRAKKITIDALFALSTIMMLAVSIVGLAFPLLGIKLLCDMVLLTFGMKYLGTALQKYIKDDQTGEQSLLDRIPPKHVVKVVKDNRAVEVALKDLQPGDIISLSGGQYVPVDVECLSECAVINTMTDGQVANAKIFSAGARLNQGMSIDLASQAQNFKVVATYHDSYCYKLYSFITELQNQEKDPNFNNVIKYFVVVVVLMAIITGLLFYGWLCPWESMLNAIICVLTSVCPCPLGLNKGFVAQAVRSEMQNKNVKCGNVKLLQKPLTDLVCDLNGTLTEAEPSEIIVVDLGETKQELNQLIYRLEKNEVHPYARAICNKLTSQDPSLIEKFKDERLSFLDRSNHSGVTATIGESKVQYRIGNENMMRGKLEKYKEIIRNKEGNQVSAHYQYIYIEEGEGDSARLIGYIKVGVKLRRHARKIIKYYQNTMKMRVHICTGADEQTVNAYLANEEIKDVTVIANCTALSQSESGQRDKLTYIQHLQQQGKGVVGVGDAANDIPFLLQCDMGIAMQSPAADTMTQTVANFSIQSLTDLPLKLPLVEAILRNAAKLKNNNDIIICALNLLIMFIPMFLMGLLGFVCPPCLGPLLMLVPLLGVCIHTAYVTLEQPLTVSKPNLSISSTTASLLTPEVLGYPSPKPLRKRYADNYDSRIKYSLVSPIIELTTLPVHEVEKPRSLCFEQRR